MATPGPSSLALADVPALNRVGLGGSLELRFQPEFDLATGAIVAMEGLLRWQHPTLGLLRPPAFLELADNSGDMVSIGQWVLGAGADEAARWAALPGVARRLWLNVSAAELVSEGFVELVADVVREHELEPGALGLEIAESCVVALGRSARPLLDDLRAAGVALAVDDFSSFYAVLGAIDALQLDAVKIGRRYVRGVGESVGPDGRGDPLVTAIIEQAHAHGLYVVAEGVESWGEAARLTELGCDRAHGWLFATAEPAVRARRMLERAQGWQRSAWLPQPRREG